MYCAESVLYFVQSVKQIRKISNTVKLHYLALLFTDVVV
jgi:hypothetical protein